MAEIHGFWLTSMGVYFLVLHPEGVELILVQKCHAGRERGSRDLLDLGQKETGISSPSVAILNSMSHPLQSSG